jgi:DNA-binding response OmpR family regulator
MAEQGARDGSPAEARSGRLAAGNIDLDLATFQVSVGNGPAKLTYQEFELLRHLADFRDHVVSFDVLNGLIWGATGSAETKRLNVLVCRLRAKLAESFPYQIETVRGRGYGLLSSAGRSGSATELKGGRSLKRR